GSEDFRPLAVFPLPSRIDGAEHSLRQDWRRQCQGELQKLFRKIYDIEDCNLSEYFDEVQLPHISYYAYGEKIAILEEWNEALSLRRAYEAFFDHLTKLDYAWESPEKAGTINQTRFRCRRSGSPYFTRAGRQGSLRPGV